MDQSCHYKAQKSFSFSSSCVHPPSDSSLLSIRLVLVYNYVNHFGRVDLLEELGGDRIVIQGVCRTPVVGKVRVLGVGIRCDPGCVTAAGLSLAFPLATCPMSFLWKRPPLPCLDRFSPLGGAGGSGEGKRLELSGDGSRLAPLGLPTATTRRPACSSRPQPAHRR